MGKTVLLVEDEPHIIEALSFLLEQAGWRVLSHSDGADATLIAANIRPDVMVLDAMLPNKSGFEVLREIRERPDLTALPVLMLTAKGQTKDRAAAEAAGANKFMTKPFSNQEVVEAVRALAPNA
jgi:DNA-binding response OmpR family regulator